MMVAEPVAQPPEAGDDLVADQQDTVFAADRLDARPVAGGRDDNASGPLYRLADEGGDMLRADAEDTVLDGLGGARGEGILAFAGQGLVEGIGLHDMLDARDRQAALRMHRRHAAERRASDGGAVIGIVSADEDAALRLAAYRPVMPHHPQHRVVRLRPRRVEEHVLQIATRNARDARGERYRGRRRGLEEGVVIRQLEHLIICRARQFLAAIADRHAPQPGHAVEDGVAVAVPDRTAIGAGDDARAAKRGDQRKVRLRRQVMRHVETAQLGDVVVAQQRGHGSALSGGGMACRRL